MSRVNNVIDTKSGTKAAVARVRERFTQAAAHTRRIGREVIEHVPETTKRGFRKGRHDGRTFVEHGIPHAVGYGAGFGFGATEAIVSVLAKPANCLIGVGLGLGAWAARAIGLGCRGEGDMREEQVEAA